MSKFVFITDLHITDKSNVRTGDILTDICDKLEYVVGYANQTDSTILIGGDVFDHPSVPDYVKVRVAAIFRKAKNTIYSIAGNHDILYNNEDFNHRTSYNLFVEFGVFENLVKMELDDVVLSSTLPVQNVGKPQIVIYHGFYNVEDGKCTCKTSDVITTQDECVVLLGHDHSVYLVENPRNNVRVYREGSFLRGIRTDDQKRIPNMVCLHVENGKIDVRLEPIKCRAASEIFEAKSFSFTPSQTRKSYEDVISKIKDAHNSDLTLESALKQVTTPDVVDYVLLLASEQ